MTVLEATNVHKRFGDEQVLRGIDMLVEEGEIVLLMGPNGVGKSVFMSCLAGSNRITEGSITLFDSYDPVEARSMMSVMKQGEMTVPDLTGRENIEFYRGLHPRGTGDVEQILERLEMEDDADRLVRSYSGGMKRKIEVAIALSVDVPLYLLDEPVAELDLSMIRVLHDMILERRETGAAFLITSHTPLDAQIADRIAFVQHGRIVTSSAPEALLETLPRVLRIRGGVPPEELLVGGRAFHRGDEVRGFLSEGTSLTDVKSAQDANFESALVEIDRPSYTDLFNFYTYLEPSVMDGIQPVAEQ
ncbi:ABC transporter ATP-binding protein [Natronorubrum sp. DTA7]|uniref:ABC transporter ATP-binding protein n=1 Tax=Natronorubrum sp. DTA7 TaxID=3447016 RepID=UPI003F83D5BD